jgi:hypothetical protein
MEKELGEIERALFSENVQEVFISALEERLNAPSESLLEPKACRELCDASASLIAQYGVQSFEVMLHAAKVEQLATSFDVHIMSLTIPELATASAALDALSKLLSMLDMRGMNTVRYHARCWELCKPLSMALHSWDDLGDTMTSRYAKDANRGVARELLGLSAKVQALVSEQTDMFTLPVNFKAHKEVLDLLILSEVQPTNLEDINTKTAGLADSLEKTYHIGPDGAHWHTGLELKTIAWSEFQKIAADICPKVEGDKIDNLLSRMDAMQAEQKKVVELFGGTIDDSLVSEQLLIKQHARATMIAFLCYVVVTSTTKGQLSVSKRRLLKKRTEELQAMNLLALIPTCLHDKIVQYSAASAPGVEPKKASTASAAA